MRMMKIYNDPEFAKDINIMPVQQHHYQQY
jgi:hypothetical protein